MQQHLEGLRLQFQGLAGFADLEQPGVDHDIIKLENLHFLKTSRFAHDHHTGSGPAWKPMALPFGLVIAALTHLVLEEVYVNGQGPFRFLLDTGAQSCVLSPHLAGRLSLRPSYRVSVVTVNGGLLAPVAKVSSLAADGVERANGSPFGRLVLVADFDSRTVGSLCHCRADSSPFTYQQDRRFLLFLAHHVNLCASQSMRNVDGFSIEQRLVKTDRVRYRSLIGDGMCHPYNVRYVLQDRCGLFARIAGIEHNHFDIIRERSYQVTQRFCWNRLHEPSIVL